MTVSKTWWGEKFIDALCSFIEENRLTRGRAYRSEERIVEYTQKENKVIAKIKGNKNPYFGVYKVPYYKTEITFVPPGNWEEVLDSMAKDLLVLAKLATKELPSSISILLPKNSHDMTTHCSCPDYENPCKHIAGLYFRLAEEMDHDPFLLLRLRGIPQQELEKRLQHLMPKPTHNPFVLQGSEQPQEAIKLRDFWGTTQKIKEPESLPIIPCLLIKKAGINPSFWHKNKPFVDVMEGLYKTAKRTWDKPLTSKTLFRPKHSHQKRYR